MREVRLVGVLQHWHTGVLAHCSGVLLHLHLLLLLLGLQQYSVKEGLRLPSSRAGSSVGRTVVCAPRNDLWCDWRAC